jgi:hypothetical protein
MNRTQASWLVVLVFAGLAGCAMHRAPGMNGCPDGACNAPTCGGVPGGVPGEACGNCGQGACCDTSNGYFHPGACSEPCPRCGHCPCLCHGRQEAGTGADGAGVVGTVTYPYYTVRGPRDFLAKNPPSIGP